MFTHNKHPNNIITVRRDNKLSLRHMSLQYFLLWAEWFDDLAHK